VTSEATYRNKGGRPKKETKMTEQLAVMCTLEQRKIIEQKAKDSFKSVSEYLRTLGLSGNVVMLVKKIPAENLAFTAALNHLGALLNQIAKKRNSNEELNAFERADLMMLTGRLKTIVSQIEKRMQ
jgi:hypothetical protein